jgi:hypothetical protein
MAEPTIPPAHCVSIGHCTVSMSDDRTIHLELEEHLWEANMDGPHGLEAWKRGDAFHLIPESERHRQRYRSDPIREGLPVGQFRDGIHYGEVSVMRVLEADGFTEFLYEVFELFQASTASASTDTTVRSELARERLGPAVSDHLRRMASCYRAGDERPKIPDVMSWKEAEGERYFFFVESKNERDGYIESVKDSQLLGLALLALIVPRSTVAIYRWMSPERIHAWRQSGGLPRSYVRSFHPNRE